MKKIISSFLVFVFLLACVSVTVFADTMNIIVQNNIDEYDYILLDENSLNTVECSTVDELLSAIASNTSIILTEDMYDLSTAKNYGGVGGDCYRWEEVYDGYELVIENVRNLSISGAEGKNVTVAAIPRYADVFSVRDSNGVSLYNLTLGHTMESGSCVGGVVESIYNEGFTIENCSLYGCGIIGINAVNCNKLFVTNTKIYDCSEGAVYYEHCTNSLLDGVEIYNCNAFSYLISIVGSKEIGIINSYIHNNTAPVFLRSDYAKNVFLGGVKTENNSFEGLISASNYQVIVDGCFFNEKAGIDAYPVFEYLDDAINLGAVTPNGEEISKKDLFAGELKENVVWLPDENSEVYETEELSEATVHVSNIDELLNAIGSNRTIFLEPGVYQLSQAQDYGITEGKWYSWESEYDGPQLVINSVENLTIKGEDCEKVEILAEPRYATVITFYDCPNIAVEGITVGHTPDTGICSGGVLEFDSCSNVNVSNAKLFGCGTVGIFATNCDGINVKNAEIYDCSFQAITLSLCSNVNLDWIDVHDNENDTATIYDCYNVYVINSGAREGAFLEYKINDCRNVKIIGCPGNVYYNVNNSINVITEDERAA